MTLRHLMGSLMALYGGVLLGGALLQWQWFVAQRKYRRLAESTNPLVPRVLYGILGAVLIVFGVMNVMGMWLGGWDGKG